MAHFTVDGVALFYREEGDGPAVLLIHGGGVNADHWGPCFHLVAQFARAIAYDQRGFSRSVHPPVRGIKRHGDDAAALLRGLSAAPAVVLGHSFGGAISLDLAARYPELVQALVLIEPVMDLAWPLDPSILALGVKFHARRALRGDENASEFFHRWAATYSTGGTSFDLQPQRMREAAIANALGLAKVFSLSPEFTGSHLRKGGVTSICCPVTLIEGALSQPGLRRVIRRLECKLPQSKVITAPNSSHVVQFDAPDLVIQAVRRAVLPEASLAS